MISLKTIVLAAACSLLTCTTATAQNHNDFANYRRYAQENARLGKPAKGEKRVVFMGNSITEGWVNTHAEFFKKHGYIGRGIGGQTSYQFLMRFREDVINLEPRVLVLNYGTNDPLMSPEDIANAIIFLSSPLAHGINGVVLFVDGGTDALLNSEKVY